MFVRFIIARNHPSSGVSQGIFQTAYQLRNSGELLAYEENELNAVLSWFNSHLERPVRFKRSTSKGHDDRDSKGISWFKPTATKHLVQIRRVIAVLEENGWLVSMIKTRNPGYIVYEDDYQVVAEPFADTPT